MSHSITPWKSIRLSFCPMTQSSISVDFRLAKNLSTSNWMPCQIGMWHHTEIALSKLRSSLRWISIESTSLGKGMEFLSLLESLEVSQERWLPSVISWSLCYNSKPCIKIWPLIYSLWHPRSQHKLSSKTLNSHKQRGLWLNRQVLIYLQMLSRWDLKNK